MKCKYCGKEIKGEGYLIIPHPTTKNPKGKYYYCSQVCKDKFELKKTDRKNLDNYIKYIYIKKNNFKPENIPWALIKTQIKQLCSKYNMTEKQIFEILVYIVEVEGINPYNPTSNNILGLVPYKAKECKEFIKLKLNKKKNKKTFSYKQEVIKCDIPKGNDVIKNIKYK